MYKIDNHVPMPPEPENGRHMLYPYRQLQVGESFFAPVQALGTSRMREMTGFKFRTRRCVEDGVPGIRCWRIA
jgi:hypothetical protein